MLQCFFIHHPFLLLHLLVLLGQGTYNLSETVFPYCCTFLTDVFTQLILYRSFTRFDNYFQILNYAAMLLEMPKEELAEVSYQNATRLFSYPGSKVPS